MRKTIALTLATLWMLAGCGGGDDSSSQQGGDTTYLPPDETLGGEDMATDMPPDEGGPTGPIPTGPGQLTVKIVVEGEEVAGNVQVLSASGEVVGEGHSGQTFTVDSGDYTLVGQITDRNILVDTPTREADEMVTVGPGEQVTGNVTFGRARVKLNVRRNGRPVGNWRVELTRIGAEEGTIEMRPSQNYVPVSPGRYNGVVHTGSMRIEVSGIVFMGGATQDIPVNIQ